MKKAKLEVLGLEVPIDPSKVYYDDGFVGSITEHSLNLVDRYYTSIERGYWVGISKANLKNRIRKSEPAYGRTITFDFFARRYIHIFYLDYQSPEWVVSLRAHEETHALEGLGHLDMLAEKILKEQRVRINFNEIECREVRADIGAIYALNAHGLEFFFPVSSFPSFHTARVIYEQSRLPGEQK